MKPGTLQYFLSTLKHQDLGQQFYDVQINQHRSE